MQRDLGLAQLQGALAALEVVAGRDLAPHLVEGVDQLLVVEVAHHVEREVGHALPILPYRSGRYWAVGEGLAAPGLPDGAGVSTGRVTVMVRTTGFEVRSVMGSVATTVTTFEPGTSWTRSVNAPVSDAVVLGFSRRPSTVIAAFGTVVPRNRYDVSS